METPQEPPSKEEGLRLLKAGQLDEAIEVLGALVQTMPDDAQLHTYLGVAYNQKGDRLRTINHFEESLRIEPTARSYYNLGQVYESVNRVDEAVRQYRMGAELDPGYAPAQEALNRLHEQYEAAHPQPQPVPEPTIAVPAAVAGPQPTQAMPAGGGVPGVYAGAPTTYGPGVQGPAASPYGPPPDVLDMKRKKEQEVVEQRKRMMKSGLIYGVVSGTLMVPAVYFGIARLLMIPMPEFAMQGLGLFLWLLILMAIGAGTGGAIGFWVGYTCGGESAGVQAGLALGIVLAVIFGAMVHSRGGSFFMIGSIMLGFGLLIGYLVGMMVDRSIGWD